MKSKSCVPSLKAQGEVELRGFRGHSCADPAPGPITSACGRRPHGLLGDAHQTGLPTKKKKRKVLCKAFPSKRDVAYLRLPDAAKEPQDLGAALRELTRKTISARPGLKRLHCEEDILRPDPPSDRLILCLKGDE